MTSAHQCCLQKFTILLWVNNMYMIILGGDYCCTSANATKKLVFQGNLMSTDLALAASGMGTELACGEITKPLIQNMFFTWILCIMVPGRTAISCSSLPSSFGVHTFCALSSSFYCQKHNYPPSLRCLLMLQNVCLEFTDQELCTDTEHVQQIHSLCTAEHNVHISHFHQCVSE